ncbi:MAG: hypothetical protein BWX84_02029 [Verrucomicrobia bacterium ADurb.Bin118]|nr:MAG: hypothetical protein BWX84_02029 [Verrucomicrobia bacterium ADurb.Bin118]
MVGLRAGQSHQTFHDVKPAHRVGRPAQFTALGKVPNQRVTFVFVPEEIAIERENTRCFIEPVTGTAGVAPLVVDQRCFRVKGSRGRHVYRRGIHRLVQEPLALR